MKRTCRFVRSAGRAVCLLPSGERLELPVVPGILKHPPLEQLARLLEKPAVARKYTREALRKAPWPALREFPPRWLRALLKEADLPPPRRRALEFLLAARPEGPVTK